MDLKRFDMRKLENKSKTRTPVSIFVECFFFSTSLDMFKLCFGKTFDLVKKCLMTITFLRVRNGRKAKCASLKITLGKRRLVLNLLIASQNFQL